MILEFAFFRTTATVPLNSDAKNGNPNKEPSSAKDEMNETNQGGGGGGGGGLLKLVHTTASLSNKV